jgi:hypothetical protein
LKNIKVIYKNSDKIPEGSSTGLQDKDRGTDLKTVLPSDRYGRKNHTDYFSIPPPAGGHGVRLRKEKPS